MNGYWKMRTNDIYRVYVSYANDKGGKHRPVLIVEIEESTISVFRFTTKYQNKSEAIKSKYYEVQEWQEAGLNRPSWIDIGSVVRVKKASFKGQKQGRLTIEDQKRLLRFIATHNDHSTN